MKGLFERVNIALSFTIVFFYIIAILYQKENATWDNLFILVGVLVFFWIIYKLGIPLVVSEFNKLIADSFIIKLIKKISLVRYITWEHFFLSIFFIGQISIVFVTVSLILK